MLTSDGVSFTIYIYKLHLELHCVEKRSSLSFLRLEVGNSGGADA